MIHAALFNRRYATRSIFTSFRGQTSTAKFVSSLRDVISLLRDVIPTSYPRSIRSSASSSSSNRTSSLICGRSPWIRRVGSRCRSQGCRRRLGLTLERCWSRALYSSSRTSIIILISASRSAIAASFAAAAPIAVKKSTC